jgi:hypothetical protein
MRAYLAAENIAIIERQTRVQAERRKAPTAIVADNPVVQLKRILGILEEQHKLPKKIILTRWLSCAEAVSPVLQGDTRVEDPLGIIALANPTRNIQVIYSNRL